RSMPSTSLGTEASPHHHLGALGALAVRLLFLDVADGVDRGGGWDQSAKPLAQEVCLATLKGRLAWAWAGAGERGTGLCRGAGAGPSCSTISACGAGVGAAANGCTIGAGAGCATGAGAA